MGHDRLLQEEAGELVLVVRETKLEELVLLGVQLQHCLVSNFSVIWLAFDFET